VLRQFRETVPGFPPQKRFTALENHKPAPEPLELGEDIQSLLPAKVRTRLTGTPVVRTAGTVEIAAIGQLETGQQGDLPPQYDGLESID
jgi:hypothetical protein